jgi:hypothetical protein
LVRLGVLRADNPVIRNHGRLPRGGRTRARVHMDASAGAERLRAAELARRRNARVDGPAARRGSRPDSARLAAWAHQQAIARATSKAQQTLNKATKLANCLSQAGIDTSKIAACQANFGH